MVATLSRDSPAVILKAGWQAHAVPGEMLLLVWCRRACHCPCLVLTQPNASAPAAQLDVFRPLAFPLLTSPLVGATAAFDACRTLAGCLPVPELSSAALPLACSLRLVMLTQKARCCCCRCMLGWILCVNVSSWGLLYCLISRSHSPSPFIFQPAPHPALPASAPQEGGAADWQHLSNRQCVGEAVTALAAATGGSAPGEEPVPAALRRPLPGPTYMFAFPILRAVMRCASCCSGVVGWEA